jgi:eukaryotic-like serine/threonine-protein kinase
MNMTGPLVLPEGISFIRAEDLSTDLRRQTNARAGEFAVSRPQSRTPSRMLDAQAVALLRQFETPKTIAQAVAHYSRTVGCDPQQTLEQAIPMLAQLVSWRLLVSPDSGASAEIRPSYDAGVTVIGSEVLQCVQALEDSEIYKVRRPTGQNCACKILRKGCSSESHRMFDREASILRTLSGSVSPSLLDDGIWEERRYLLLEWFEGTDVDRAAAGLRRSQGMDSQRQLLSLCSAVLRTYFQLHQRGVIHSDVHPRNILINEAGLIRILDYGLAQQPDANAEFGTSARGGMGFFFEPEYAAAVRAGQQPPATTCLGEQYALGALLYFLLTGDHYLDFSLTKDEMMRQICEDSPVPFEKRGLASWPQVENILVKALNKAASGRFASVSDFADVLEAVEPSARVSTAGVHSRSSQLEALARRSLDRVGFEGELLQTGVTTAPKASVTYGSAGIAYALYRMACQRQEPSLLALADVWCSRSATALDKDESYYNPQIEITPEVVGSLSPYHTSSGIHAVQVLVSHARCDLGSQLAGLEAFLLSSQQPCDNLDLALGRSGALLASSLLHDALKNQEGLDLMALRDFGTRTLELLWSEIDEQPPVREGSGITYLGIAHGWAGILYATLAWGRTSDANLPLQIEERLQQLAALAEPCQRSVRWPWELPKRNVLRESVYMPGWCNGTAGHVFLWLAAHRAFREELYLRLAERAALNAWESIDSIGNLCCGLAGQAYSLLSLYRYTNEKVWLDRASELAQGAAARVSSGYNPPGMTPTSLYKGELGVALLSSDLSASATACMPFFELEGWS